MKIKVKLGFDIVWTTTLNRCDIEEITISCQLLPLLLEEEVH